MQKFLSNFQDRYGNGIPGATITVYDVGTEDPAFIFEDDETTEKSGSKGITTTDINGQFSFKAADGDYDIKHEKSGYETKYFRDVQFLDRAGVKSSLASFSGVSYDFIQDATPTATAADEWWLETDTGSVYKSTASGTGNWVEQFQHVIRNNGVYLLTSGDSDFGYNHLVKCRTILNQTVFKGFYFDGANDYLFTADDADLDLGTQDFSIVLFPRTSTDYSGGICQIISKRDGSNSGYQVGIKTDNKLTVIVDEGSEISIDTDIAINDGYQHGIAALGDRSGNLTMYRDGFLQTDSAVMAGTTVSNAQVLYTGSDGGSTEFYQGELYGYKIFNRLLTADEAIAFSSNPQKGIEFSDQAASNTDLTSGTLTIGKRYRINTYVSSDDFTNVGAASNATGVEFIATGTTPTDWTNSSVLNQIGCICEYKGENISSQIWYEQQNSNNATVSGATVTNSSITQSTTTVDTGFSPETELNGIKRIENGVIYYFDDWDGTEIIQGSANLTSGTLTSGNMYKIVTFVAGDDFSNIGGTNVSGTKFIATGTTPTTWTNSSVLYDVGNAYVVPYKKALSNVFTGFEVVGYEGLSEFRRFKFLSYGFHWVKSRDNATSHSLSDFNIGSWQKWSSETTAAKAATVGNYIKFLDDGKTLELGTYNATYVLDSSYIMWNWHYPLAKAWHANGGTSRKVQTPWGIVDSVESNASSGLTGDQVVLELYNPLTGNGCLLYVGTGANRLLDISGGVAPEFFFAKTLSSVAAAYVYHAYQNGGTDPGDYYLDLTSTAAEGNSNTPWNDTEPTASLISLGTSTNVNASGVLQILYYFSPKTGLQAFGGYAGNSGSNDQATGCLNGLFGTKSRTGGTSRNWVVYDSVRGDSKRLNWNGTNTEGTIATVAFDTPSGIELNSSDSNVNINTDDYVYWHFGEEMVIQGDIDCFPVDAETATSTNDTVKIVVEVDTAATINTEFKVYATREATPNWVLGTLVDTETLSDGVQQWTAEIDIGGNAAGTSMRWRIVTDESGSETEHNIYQLKMTWT